MADPAHAVPPSELDQAPHVDGRGAHVARVVALERALRTGGHVPLPFRTVAVFTVGGIALAGLSVVLVVAQT